MSVQGTPLNAIVTRFVEKMGLQRGVTIFAGSDPDIPSIAHNGPAVLSVTSTPGRAATVPADADEDSEDGLFYPHFQITARHPSYQMAEALAYAAHKAIRMSNRRIGDVFFLWAFPLQPPFDLGRDVKGRPRSVFNVDTCWRR